MAKTLGSLPVGSVVKLKYNNQPTEFIVIYQGLPSGYAWICRGTWLLSKNSLGSVQWHRENVTQELTDASIHYYQNPKVYENIEFSLRNYIKRVTLPYITQSNETSTFSTHIFQLSRKETEFPCFASNPKLLNCEGDEGNSAWWLRDLSETRSTYAKVVWPNKPTIYAESMFTSDNYLRAAMVVDSALFVSDNNNITTNQPPSIPTTINLPSTIKGGASCSVSWSAATDPDGNLEGYIVERSYNGGSSWSQIYQGSATSTSTTIPHGTSTVMFRVCAYDTDGEKSGWRTSSNKTVLNNRAPNAPPSINVPVSPQGGASISVTWSSSSDPDGNLEGYRLERQWDGAGAFDQIYQGSGLSYTDTIPKGAHTSVTYRVRAYDAFGETSGYTTSPVRTIDNNLAPVIQCDLSGNLGDKSEGFVVPYTVTDAENHAVTVTERVGNLVKRTYSVTLGQSNSFQITGDYFQKILNGEQAAEIIATDTEGKSGTLSLTFTKKVHRASIMLSEPLTVENPITVCVIKVVGNIPEDAEFKVEVANNLGDESPAWEDATDAAKRGINHVFKNKTQVNGWKFGFRVTAERGASDTAGYMTSIQGGFQ